MEAALASGYRPDEVDTVPPSVLAVVLARYRVRRRVDAITAHWQSEEAKRKK